MPPIQRTTIGNKSFFCPFCVILGFGEHVIVLLVYDILFNNAHYFILCYIVNYVYASFAEINLSIYLKTMQQELKIENFVYTIVATVLI
jgi:hypothetical protein